MSATDVHVAVAGSTVRFCGTSAVDSPQWVSLGTALHEHRMRQLGRTVSCAECCAAARRAAGEDRQGVHP